MTTLRKILRSHAEYRPLVYLSDGATDWYASTLLTELAEQSGDDGIALLDADEFWCTTDGICRVESDVPDYRYRAAWALADAAESARAVPDLETLLAALKQLGDADDNVDTTSLPTFGGDEPRDTNEVWSWDATRLLVGTCASNFRIVNRGARE